MFDWLTKPYMQWTFIDNIISTIMLVIIIVSIWCIASKILELKDKIKYKKRNKNK